MTAAAVTLAAVAVGLVRRPSPGLARLMALRERLGSPVRPRLTIPMRTGLLAWSAGGATAIAVWSLLGFGVEVPVLPAVAGAIAAGTAATVLSRGAADRAGRRSAAALVESVGILAADLRAGQSPGDALTALAGDPVTGHRAVLAVWAVSERSGAPTAAVLDRVEQDLRARESQTREIAAQLAGARSTAGLLALLPALGDRARRGDGRAPARGPPRRTARAVGSGGGRPAGGRRRAMDGTDRHRGARRPMSPPALVLCALAAALARRPRRPRRPATKPARPAPVRLAAAALGVALTLVIGGVFGVAAGLGAFVAADRLLRRLEPTRVRRSREIRAAELPLTLNLLSVCLQAGVPLVAALETVADAMPGPFSADLATVAGLQRLGACPATAWAGLSTDPDLAPVARAVGRSAESGGRLAAAFDRIAADRRSALAASGLARARSAGVIAMAPLGLCFLPAFVCLGIVPIVLSLAAEVLP